MFDLLGIQNEKITLLDDQGLVEYYPSFFENDFTQSLDQEIAWRQEEITLYGKTHNVPRLSCWFADDAKEYTYSGIKHIGHEWTATMLKIKHLIEGTLGRGFNSCLANKYRDGKDYAAWHSDDEKELGRNPMIASASFGETRYFHLRHKKDKGRETIKIALENNSLLVMSGALQHHWKHQLAKTSKSCEARINLTFRQIL